MQAKTDCGSKLPVVATYRTGGKLKEWMVSMPAEAFFKLIEQCQTKKKNISELPSQEHS